MVQCHAARFAKSDFRCTTSVSKLMDDLGWRRIFKTRFKYDLHKFYFTNRVVDAWNSLPNWIVMANSTNTFKCRLDTYWQDQKITRNRKS